MTATLQPQLWMRSPELRQPERREMPIESSEVDSFRAIDQFLDLSRPQSRLDTFRALDDAERTLFTRHLQELFRLGIVGTDTLEVDGEERQVFADTAYADPRLRDARPVRRSALTRIDLRA